MSRYVKVRLRIEFLVCREPGNTFPALGPGATPEELSSITDRVAKSISISVGDGVSVTDSNIEVNPIV